MKLRHAIIFAISATLLAACTFTLAADVTPPPGYVSPTPAPTLGPLFPASAPDTVKGAAIFAEKCAPCHGTTGMGDGPQSASLPATVAAIGLSDVANKAAPSAWFTVVTQGNLEKFMPPFTSLSDQERWDVISYALTLHTTPEQIEAGKALFETSCDAACAKKFTNLEMMSALSEDDIVAMIKTDGAFGSGFTDEEAANVAAYIRSTTFAAPQSTPTAASATETPVSADAGTPSAEATPVDGTQAEVTPEAVAGIGNISGVIENKTGADLPSDLKVTLRGYEHGADPNAGPTEILTLETTVNADGSYTFENVDVPENRIFVTEVDLNGIQYQSEFLIIKPELTEFAMTPITAYGTTEDYSVLKVDSLQMYFDYANENDVQIIAVYTITNPSDKAVILKLDAAQEIPFIKMPDGVTNMGYETSQDSASFISLSDGFAMPPTTADKPYGLIALASVAKDKKISIAQSVVLPVEQAMLLVPTGVTATGDTLTNNGAHDFQGTSFDLYTSSASLNAGDKLSFTLSGSPSSSTAVNPDLTQNQNLLIGIGGLGLALIIAGAWLYWRDNRKNKASDDEEDEGEEDEYEDAESILDAIVAIDDLHRTGKISDEAYQKRRAELKSALKRKS
jgi:mono/diheme cytochrome c family protein